MRKLFWFLSILTVFAPVAPAISEGSRMSPIIDSYLMEGMIREGVWEIDISERKIEYRCKDCSPKLAVRIEALLQPSYEDLKRASETYYARRKRYCARLASDLKGRCVSSERLDWRAGCLTGFKSIQDYRNTRQVVFAYYYGGHDSWAGSSTTGPEILKATIIQDGRTNIPQKYVGRFGFQLIRLTGCW